MIKITILCLIAVFLLIGFLKTCSFSEVEDFECGYGKSELN